MVSWLRSHAFALAVPLLLAIGWLDYVTGPELGLSLLYLGPVGTVAWLSGRWRGLVCAAIAALCWQVADLAWHSSGGMPVSLWNGFTRLTIYTASAWLIDRVHVDRAQLQALNQNLELALEREASLARTDPVTRLPNSRAFLEHLRSDIARFAQPHCSAALLFLDLDNFKSVNDEYGHAVGDDVLARIADGLQEQVHGADMAARIGGDEFVVLAWHPDESGADRTRDAIEAVVRGVASDYPRSSLGVSIGIARIDDTTRDPEEIIRVADHAMYEMKTKRQGRARETDPDSR